MSRSAIKDAEACAKFIAEDNVTYTVGWRTHCHDHHHKCFTQWRTLGRQCFPIAAAAPRQSFLSDATWQILLWRRSLRKSLKYAKTDSQTCVQRAVLHALKACVRSPYDTHIAYLSFSEHQLALSSAKKMSDHSQAYTLALLRTTHSLAKNASKEDRVKAIEDRAGKVAAAARSNDHKAVFAHHS